MARSGMAGQGSGSGLRGEKRPRIGVASGELARTTVLCELCAVLGRNGPAKRRYASSGRGHGLRIVLLDGDEETRLAARQMLRVQRDGWALDVYHPCCPVGEASQLKHSSRPSWQEGDHCLVSPADLVLIALSRGERARLTCVRKVKALAPDLPLLIIGDDSDEASIAEVCAAGADGYLLKPVAPEELARALGSAARGWPVLCREAQKAILNLLHRAATATTAWFPGLSGREQEIAGCLVAHLRDKEISDRLGIARGTVHAHLVRLYRNLRVHNRRQAVARLLGGAKSNPF